MTQILILGVIWGIIGAIPCGFLARRQQRDVPTWVLYGFVFGPFALPVLALLGRPRQAATTTEPRA